MRLFAVCLVHRDYALPLTLCTDFGYPLTYMINLRRRPLDGFLQLQPCLSLDKVLFFPDRCLYSHTPIKQIFLAKLATQCCCSKIRKWGKNWTNIAGAKIMLARQTTWEIDSAYFDHPWCAHLFFCQFARWSGANGSTGLAMKRGIRSLLSFSEWCRARSIHGQRNLVEKFMRWTFVVQRFKASSCHGP